MAIKRDIYAGALIVMIGALLAWKAPDYQIGTLAHMGPGFMPMALGVLLIGLGAAIAVSPSPTSMTGEGAPISRPPQWRGWLCILGGPISFIVLGRYGGFLPGAFACVFVAALGDRTMTLRSAFTLAAIVTLVCVALFIYLLQIPMPLIRTGAL
jgi:hypothetical protein